ncbi:MAG: hypothetical protein ACKOVH_05240 [Actinomycetota bacterium]
MSHRTVLPSSTRGRVALSVLVLVGLLAVVGAGTFAGFNAETRNPGNQFATGTLVLGNTKASGASCLSTAGGTTDANVNPTCDQLFDLAVRKPGDSASARVTIANQGSVAASALRVFSAACVDADVAAETYHGTGNPCSKIQLVIQRYSDAAFTTPVECVYGGGSASTCDWTDATKTLAAFQGTHGTAATGRTVGSGLASGAARYFEVRLLLPSTSDNTFQGRQATVDLTWYAEQ